MERSTAPSTCHAKCLSGPISAQISSSHRLVVCSVLSKTSRPVVAIAFASIDCLRTWPLRALSTAFGFGALLGRRHVTPMHLRRGRGCLHGCERLQYPVTVPGARGHQPGIARLQPHRLPLKVELGATGNNVADGLVIPFSDRHRVRLFVLPQPHRYALARGEIRLPHVAAGRCPAADLLDSGIWRHGSYSRLTAPRYRFPLKNETFLAVAPFRRTHAGALRQRVAAWPLGPRASRPHISQCPASLTVSGLDARGSSTGGTK